MAMRHFGSPGECEAALAKLEEAGHIAVWGMSSAYTTTSNKYMFCYLLLHQGLTQPEMDKILDEKEEVSDGD